MDNPVFTSNSPVFSELGLGILSWRGYESLRATLQSYRDSGFLDLFEEKLLFLPEIEDSGVKIAKEFGLNYNGTPNNLGILGGFKAMAEAMTSEYLLLAENDFQLSDDHDAPANAIKRALLSLKQGESSVWRFRHLRHPGQKFYIGKTMRYWPKPNSSLSVRLLSALRRIIRPSKAARLRGLAPYIYDDSPAKFPDVIKATEFGDFLIRSDVINWTNNVFLIKRSFFLENIIPEAEANIADRLINGFPTIETEMNRSKWWRTEGLWVGVSNPGLFTHDRLNDRGY